MNAMIKEAMVDYVASLRARRQHTIARVMRVEAFELPESESMLQQSQDFIDHIDAELDKYERKLGWR